MTHGLQSWFEMSAPLAPAVEPDEPEGCICPQDGSTCWSCGGTPCTPAPEAVEPEPTDIEALLKEADDYAIGGTWNTTRGMLTIHKLADALRALHYDLERLKGELRIESATKAALQARLGQAEQERDRLMKELSEELADAEQEFVVTGQIVRRAEDAEDALTLAQQERDWYVETQREQTVRAMKAEQELDAARDEIMQAAEMALADGNTGYAERTLATLRIAKERIADAHAQERDGLNETYFLYGLDKAVEELDTLITELEGQSDGEGNTAMRVLQDSPCFDATKDVQPNVTGRDGSTHHDALDVSKVQALAGVALPAEIEALLKWTWAVNVKTQPDVAVDAIIKLRDALRAEATARQQLEAEIDRMRETLMFEQETGARIDDARQLAEQERDALYDQAVEATQRAFEGRSRLGPVRAGTRMAIRSSRGVDGSSLTSRKRTRHRTRGVGDYRGTSAMCRQSDESPRRGDLRAQYHLREASVTYT
jgi:hypothetical protein